MACGMKILQNFLVLNFFEILNFNLFYPNISLSFCIEDFYFYITIVMQRNMVSWK